MKRMILLLLAACFMLPAIAQKGRQKKRGHPHERERARVILRLPPVIIGNDDHRHRHYSHREYDLHRQIERINRDYDHRIRHIREDRRLRGYEKRRMIRRLEQERRQAINRLYRGYDDRRRYDDHNDRRWYDDHDDRRYRRW